MMFYVLSTKYNSLDGGGLEGLFVLSVCALNRLGPLRLTMVACDPGSLLTEWFKHHLQADSHLVCWMYEIPTSRKSKKDQKGLYMIT